jgi:short-subunit dehydrogenase
MPNVSPRGYHLILVARREERLQALAESCNASMASGPTC